MHIDRERKEKMNLGTFMTMFSRRRGVAEDVPYIEQMTACRAAGFDVQNFCAYLALDKKRKAEICEDDWQKRINALANEAAKQGVTFTQAHAPGRCEPFIAELRPTDEVIEYYLEIMRRTILACEMLGVKWMTVHPFSDNINTEYDTDILKETNLEFYAPILEFAKAHGVGLAFENMARFNKFSMLKRVYCMSAEELCDLVDTFNDEDVGVTWDFGHGRMMIANQSTALERIGHRLKATHVQDNKGTDAHLIPFVGGDINWESIMPTLKKIGYDGTFMLESGSYSQNLPEELWIPAGRLAYEFGTYCLSLADK